MDGQISGSSSRSSPKKFIIIGVIAVLVLGALVKWIFGGAYGFFGRKATEQYAERVLEKEFGGSAKVNLDSQGKVTVKTDTGEASTMGSLPASWSTDVPIYPGATILYSGANLEVGSKSSGVVLTTTKSMSDVAAYYRSELPSRGWTLKGDIVTMGTTTGIMAEKGERAVTVAITQNEGQVMVTIGTE
ncbi:MAG: hypothetical protein AAB444_03025 [Patescibacteria group bacterium]